MNQAPSDKKRKVIPRWRRFKIAATLGELSRSTAASVRSGTRRITFAAHKRNLDAWRREPSVVNAAELVLSATVAGATMDAADAADLLVRDDVKVMPELKELAVGIVARLQPLAEQVARERILPSIPVERALLSFDPRNAIGWADLALGQLVAGNEKKAEKYIRGARQLAPDNRHVLRSIASFYSHVGDPDQANYYLRKSEATLHDPWLLAAEISTAGEASRTSSFAKKARDRVLHRDYAPRDATELASALATVELEDGNTGRSKKLFRLSMEDPTENSVAQAVWANQAQRLSVTYANRQLTQPLAFEAAARVAYIEKKWQACNAALFEMMNDQPFLLAPAVTGSYIACDLLDNPTEALVFVGKGLKTNPKDATLYNNRAVAFARLGRIPEALSAHAISAKFILPDNVTQKIIQRATRGLINYRSGDAVAGAADYGAAIEAAIAARSNALIARVHLFWLQEEVFADPLCAPTALQWLKPLEAHKNDPDFNDLMFVVRNRITVLANTVKVSSPRSLSNVFGGSEQVLQILGGNAPLITTT